MNKVIIGRICYDTSCPCNYKYICRKYNPDTDSCACEEGYEGDLDDMEVSEWKNSIDTMTI